jgi:hypothetical protein
MAAIIMPRPNSKRPTTRFFDFPYFVAHNFRAVMQEKKERWLELCALAAEEQDAQKLMELVSEINRLLEEKERRLGIIPPAKVPDH